MSSEPPAAAPPPAKDDPPAAGQEKPSLGARAHARWKWIAGTIAGTFVVAVGGALANWTIGGAEHATKKVLQGTKAPLTVRVLRPGTYGSGHVYAPYYIVPTARVADPTALPKADLGHSETFFDYAWSLEHGAVPGDPQVVRLELRGRGDEPVTVSGIRALVVGRTAPVAGWYVADPACGPEPVRLATIDLDAGVPKVEYWDDSGPHKDLAVSVTRSDLELIELHASSKRSTVDWRAQVFYSGPEGEGTVTVDDGGKPFRVSTESASAGYRPDFAGGKPKLVREHSWDKNGITAC